jgi:hypothetical protein
MLMGLGQRVSDFRRNSAQRGDALDLLQSLPDYCTPLVFFDPQHRDTRTAMKARGGKAALYCRR